MKVPDISRIYRSICLPYLPCSSLPTPSIIANMAMPLISPRALGMYITFSMKADDHWLITSSDAPLNAMAKTAAMKNLFLICFKIPSRCSSATVGPKGTFENRTAFTAGGIAQRIMMTGQACLPKTKRNNVVSIITPIWPHA